MTSRRRVWIYQARKKAAFHGTEKRMKASENAHSDQS